MRISKKNFNTIALYSFLLAFFSLIASIFRGFDLKFGLVVVVVSFILGGVLGYFATLLFSNSSSKASKNLGKDLGCLNERSLLVPIIIGGIFYIIAKNFISADHLFISLSLAVGWLVGLGILKLFRKSLRSILNEKRR